MTSLCERIKAWITRQGPMTIAEYMALCLYDPTQGYYATRPRLGAAGDFLTAPEISQMFGEMIGVWVASQWEALGAPPRFRLIELGPGNGLFMQDILRTCRRKPGCFESAEIWLVENSPYLRQRQQERLSQLKPLNFAITWSEVPKSLPVILIANEFFDCLPIYQWVFQSGYWYERLVGLDPSGHLDFCLSDQASSQPEVLIKGAVPYEGAVLQTCPSGQAIAEEIGGTLRSCEGAGLIIDYGSRSLGFGDSFQAVKAHRKISPFAMPGLSDLTAHVDFQTLAEALKKSGISDYSIESQADVLLRLGLDTRLEKLIRQNPDKATQLQNQYQRLVGHEDMGKLFQVLEFTSQKPGITLNY